MRRTILGVICALILGVPSFAAWAIYRPVENVPPDGYSWPEITEFTTKDGKHCVIAVFPKHGRIAPPTLALSCTWDRPKIEPAGTNI